MFLFKLICLVFCTEPPLIDHARHNAPQGQTTFDLDTSLMYQCLPGYTTKGFARTKCFFYNGTAKWFGPDITCERKNNNLHNTCRILVVQTNAANFLIYSLNSQKLWRPRRHIEWEQRESVCSCRL